MTQSKALLISLTEQNDEIIQLADTLDYTITQTYIQKRNNPDVKYYIGHGKLNEIQKQLTENDNHNDLIIINGELKPSQWFNLEKNLNIPVYDRIRLILAIFEERAERKEARLQVKLAQLQYERPYVRELIHRARSGEHPGLMAGGEYQVDDYYEMIKKQMKKTKQQLQKIQKDRQLRRTTRHKSGFYLISLAGYTNAGKSSLLNLLTKEKVKVEGKLFSTLSTTTRKIQPPLQKKIPPILLTDTVGFIENLPTWIIDAFHSTLEEIEVADIVLLLIDASQPTDIIQKHIMVCLTELSDIGVTGEIVITFNKIDLLTPKQINNLNTFIDTNKISNQRHIALISTKTQQGIDHLIDIIYNTLPQKIQVTLQLPISDKSQAFISTLYEKTKVNFIKYNQYISISVTCNIQTWEKLKVNCDQIHGKIITSEKTKPL